MRAPVPFRAEDAMGDGSGATCPRRLRADPELVASVAGDGMHITHARTGRTFRASPQTLLVLAALADREGDELEALAATHGRAAVADAVRALRAEDLLVTEAQAASSLAAKWRDWGPAAWLMHRLSTDIEYAVSVEEQLEVAAELRDHQPPPPAIYSCRCPSGRTVDLPQPRRELGGSLTDTLLERRTCRAFGDRAVSLQETADVLFYTGGWLYREQVPLVGEVLKKCAPSPGARHTIELYPIINRCEGVDPGVYHYCVEHHRLVLLPHARPGPLARAALPGQEGFAHAPVVFVLTCVVGRLMWKYKTPRAYRHAHLEAGHYCQNLVLCVTALGLGAFQTGALAERVLHTALGIDGESEFAIYAAGAGHAADEQDTPGPVVVSEWCARLNEAGTDFGR